MGYKSPHKGGDYLLYHKWEYTAESDNVTIVQPDGCRDVILVSTPGKPTRVQVTDWDRQPYAVHSAAGTSYIGFRLRPGTTILPEIFANIEPKIAKLEHVIESTTSEDQEICEIIDALTQPNATISNIARQMGVTARTLQRQFGHLSLPVPDFWRLLGRARRSAQALTELAPLTDIAYAYGYSDQAHMTREFVRWFGYTPTQMRQNKVLIDHICQPGLGGWRSDNPSEITSLL